MLVANLVPSYLFLSLLLLLSLLRPHRAVLSCLAILPAYLLKFSLFGIPTTVLELSIYAVFIGSFISFFARTLILSRNGERKLPLSLWERVRVRELFLPIIAWFLITLLSALFSENIKIALGAWKAWVFDPILVLILIIHFFSQKNIWKIATSLGVSSAILSAYGLLEYFLWPGQLGDGRLDSVFDPANYHAMFVGPIIVLTVGFIFSPHTPRLWKFCLSIASAANIIALIFTFSYGGYLAVLSGFMIYGFLILNRAQKRKMIFGVLTIFVIFLIAAAPTKKFQNLFEYKERSSGHVRLEIWKTSWLIFKEHPILGVGINNFETAYRQTVPRVAFPPLEWLVAQPHSLYLALLTQTGLLGFAIFIWLTFSFFKLTVQSVKSNAPLAYSASSAAISAFSAILLHGLVDTPYFKNDLSVIFWILIALTAILIQPKSSHLEAEKK